eukprot:scaffold117178_cov43-Attheya_sp.AAC.1
MPPAATRSFQCNKNSTVSLTSNVTHKQFRGLLQFHQWVPTTIHSLAPAFILRQSSNSSSSSSNSHTSKSVAKCFSSLFSVSSSSYSMHHDARGIASEYYTFQTRGDEETTLWRHCSFVLVLFFIASRRNHKEALLFRSFRHFGAVAVGVFLSAASTRRRSVAFLRGERTGIALLGLDIHRPLGTSLPAVTKEDIAQILANELAPMKKSLNRLGNELPPMKKSLNHLDQNIGILVEEKTRAKARDMFGIHFSKRLLIKSVFDVIKHIAKADDASLPAEYGDLAVNAAAEKVAVVAQQAAERFVRSVVKKISANIAILGEFMGTRRISALLAVTVGDANDRYTLLFSILPFSK